MDKYEAYDLAKKAISGIISPTQLLCADYAYLCSQLEPVMKAYNILNVEQQKIKKNMKTYTNIEQSKKLVKTFVYTCDTCPHAGNLMCCHNCPNF